MWRFGPAGLAALSLGLAASLATARPFTVEDLLHQSTLGVAAFDPTGRFLVYEVRPPYAATPRFDQGDWNGRAASRLKVVDLQAEGPPEPGPLTGDPGVVIGPFAPAGGRIAVYRLADHSYRLGVADLAQRTTRWLDVTPLDAGRGRTLAWLSDDELLVLARTDDQAPDDARRGWVAAERLPALWAAHAAGRSAHTVLGSGVYAAVRDRPAPVQLLRIDLRTGSSRRLAEGAYLDFEVSPDHRRVALLTSGADRQAEGDGPVRGEAGSETEAHGLEILDLVSGAPLVPGPGFDLLPQLLSWSLDSRRLLVFARPPGKLWTDGRLLTFDADTGAARPIGEGVQPHLDLNPVRLWTDWMGGDPLLFGRLAGTGASRDDWWRLTASGPINLTHALPDPDKLYRIAGPARFRVLAGGGLWAVDPAGERPVRTGDAVAGVLIDPEVLTSRPGRGPFAQAWFRLGRGPTARLATVTPKGVAPAMDLSPAGPLVDAAANGRATVRREVDGAGVERLWLTRAGRGPERLEALNGEQADADTPEVVAVHHPGVRGERLTSWLYLPPPSASPPPLLVRPYLGATFSAPPVDRLAAGGFMINVRLLTSHGYAVLIPSLPNPPGGMTDPAVGLADRILAVVAAAQQTPGMEGRFDGARLGLIGFSFGGYSVMTTLTQTNRFAAAVSISGVSDLISYWASQSPFAYLDPAAGYVGNRMTGLVEATQPRMLGPPWRELPRYERNSPLLAADRIETPLLLIHGALDPIPHEGSEAMYSALFRQGKDAMLVTYWGAMHGLSSPGDVRDMYSRIFDFFDRRLIGDVPHPASPGVASASTGPTPPPRAP
jgi:dipeptidyl aminopeptidase/acylaminoacyl peptidase